MCIAALYTSHDRHTLILRYYNAMNTLNRDTQIKDNVAIFSIKDTAITLSVIAY